MEKIFAVGNRRQPVTTDLSEDPRMMMKKGSLQAVLVTRMAPDSPKDGENKGK